MFDVGDSGMGQQGIFVIGELAVESASRTLLSAGAWTYRSNDKDVRVSCQTQVHLSWVISDLPEQLYRVS